MNIYGLYYHSPIGVLFLEADDEGLRRLCFVRETEKSPVDCKTEKPIVGLKMEKFEGFIETKESLAILKIDESPTSFGTERFLGMHVMTEKDWNLELENDNSDGISRKILHQTCRWLDMYFSGICPDFTPKLHMMGSPFQHAVWKLLMDIPYGQTTTYGVLAKKIAAQRGTERRMAAQAIGGAVGRNPVGIIVPCHRVIGADGTLTGYAGGIDKKEKLLALEGADFKKN